MCAEEYKPQEGEEVEEQGDAQLESPDQEQQENVENNEQPDEKEWQDGPEEFMLEDGDNYIKYDEEQQHEDKPKPICVRAICQETPGEYFRAMSTRPPLDPVNNPYR